MSAESAMPMKASERLAFIRAAVEVLPTHRIGGYEWECDGCKYDFKVGQQRDSLGNVCDHETLIDRALILALLDARFEYVVGEHGPELVPNATLAVRPYR